MDDAPKLAHDLYYLGVHLQDTIIMQMIQEYLTASFIVYGDITKTMCLYIKYALNHDTRKYGSGTRSQCAGWG